MRRNPSTVVVLAGQASAELLATVGRSMNVSLVRPGAPGEPSASSTTTSGDGIETAAAALRRAAGISSPYVLVAADPLAEVAEQWRAMWDVTRGPQGSEAFELRAAEALAAWRANRFELPDYYLVLAEEAAPAAPGGPGADQEPRQDFYLGPLRSVRPHRVAVVAAAGPAEQAARLLGALGSLRHGRWWPPLEEVIDAARRFYPGALAESAATIR
jgi:hypothetical protein